MLNEQQSNMLGLHRFSQRAMNTIFEIIIQHEEKDYAFQAALAAFSELQRLEQDLSRFIENSDISRINALAENESTILSLDTFECLVQCSQIYFETNGAFDVTIGHLMNCWLNMDKSIRQPSEQEIAFAKEHSGINNLQLDAVQYSARVIKSPMSIDLGGFGKGFAVDKMVDLLLDWDLDTFLIHGGKSSVFAIGAPTGYSGWHLSLSSPFMNQKLLQHIYLKNRAVGSSGVQKGRHIINPLTAHPLDKKIAVWILTPSAALSDALSTAFMIMSDEDIHKYCNDHPEVGTMVVTKNPDNKEDKMSCIGAWQYD